MTPLLPLIATTAASVKLRSSVHGLGVSAAAYPPRPVPVPLNAMAGYRSASGVLTAG